MINVVIADDEPLILQNLQQIVPWAALGCQIAGTARNGAEAFQVCQAVEADLLLTDISMPDVTGLALLKNLAALPKPPLSVLISGYDEFDYAREGMKYGAIDYLLKPVDYEELTQCIQKAVARIQSQQQVESAQLKQHFFELLTGQVEATEVGQLTEPLVPVLVIDGRIQAENGWDFVLTPQQAAGLLKKERDRQQLLHRLVQQNSPHAFVIVGREVHSEQALVAEYQLLKKWAGLHHVIEESGLLIEQAEEQYQTKKTAADAVNKAILFIESHFQHDISAEEAAAHADMSVSYFSLLFKQVTGATFLDYVTSLRIEKACQLLRQTELKTYEIAERVGYTDQRYFSQVFKKKMDITPSEFKKQQAD